jgi:hypothetical protein
MFHEGTVVDSSDLILDYTDFMWPSHSKVTKVKKPPFDR